ncbi:MAG: hypothetical protein EBR81_11030 [Proteobacteria bacterium]|nr:hypothetical protein [Pseudomonadota bacterium]
MSSAALLAMIASIESQLNEMKTALGSATTKPKKEKDPNAPPKEANVWIKFTQRVSALLKAANIDTGVATVSKQFASSLKDQKPYGDWTDAEIVAAWPTWTPPTESKMEAKRKLSAGESGAEESDKEPEKESEKKASKPRQQKAKATKAEEPAEPAAKEAKAEKPAKAVKPAKKSYTLEQLQDFGELEHEGVEYGANARGDVVNTDGAYVGHWDGKKLTKGDKPADWAKVMPGSA